MEGPAPRARSPGQCAPIPWPAATGALLLCSALAWAGPPFLTDDPEPVEFRTWEIDAGTQWVVGPRAASGTSPHLEVNYGVLPGLQLHAILPVALSWTRGSAAVVGPGDVELGAKFRFLDESDGRPQIGIFPILMVPTGSEARGLGAGAVRALLPLWIQKGFGPWTTYGGGGLRLGPEGGALVVGWLLQRDLSAGITLGVETFVTAPLGGEAIQVQLNLGAIINFSELHHLLVSLGPAFGGEESMQSYLAYQLTI